MDSHEVLRAAHALRISNFLGVFAADQIKRIKSNQRLSSKQQSVCKLAKKPQEKVMPTAGVNAKNIRCSSKVIDHLT